jgi:hypothetical protein
MNRPVTRREFVTLLGGAATAWPLGVLAQQPGKLRLVGALMPFAEGDEEAKRRQHAFQNGLEEFRLDERAKCQD